MLDFILLFITGLFVLTYSLILFNYILKRNDNIRSIKLMIFWAWLSIMMILLLIIRIIGFLIIHDSLLF